VVHTLDLAGLERDQLGRGAGLLERFARFGQLDLLDAVARQHRDLLALEDALTHGGSLSISREGAPSSGDQTRCNRGASVCRAAAPVPPHRER